MNQFMNQVISRFSLATPIGIFSFLVFVEHLILVPLLPSIASNYEMDLNQVGILITIYPISACLSGFLWAPFSDQVGRKKLLLILSLGFIGSTLAFSLLYSFFWGALLSRVLCGFFAGPISANLAAYLSDLYSENEGRQKKMKVLTLGRAMASILGVPFGVWLSQIYSLEIPFLGIVIVGTFCCFWLYKNKRAVREERGQRQEREQKRKVQYSSLFQLLGNPQLRLLFLIKLLMPFSLYALIPNISVWLVSNFEMGITQVVNCYVIGGVGGVLGASLSSWFIQKTSEEKVMGGGSLLMACLLFCFTQEWFSAEFAGLFFAGVMFCMAIRMPAYQLLLNDDRFHSFRGRINSMDFIIANFSMGLGGICIAPLLSMQSNGMIEGVQWIGLMSLITLIPIPFLLKFYQKQKSTFIFAMFSHS